MSFLGEESTFGRLMKTHFLFGVVTALAIAVATGADPVRVAVDPASPGRSVALDRLLGGNVALWYKPGELADPSLREHLDEWKPGLLRLPGGSWSDEVYWNGNGVRVGGRFDRSKRNGDRWSVDYSGYAPGFRLGSVDGSLADFHGHSDVRGLHEFVKSRGVPAVVTVNAGTGTPEMAAEWVRWAKGSGYDVAYWEVGNELDGEWELGHTGPDGKVVDAEEYARRFIAFAKAMKAVDPNIRVGGPTCSNDKLPFVETLIREAGDQLDFVSFHTYPVLGGRKSEDERFRHADDVKQAVSRIRGWLRTHQPERADEIGIGITEWHKQVMETRPTVDLSSGLWTCLFIGAMAESGVGFANVWDMFSDVGGGGHGLFGRRDGIPRAVYHAMVLWSRHMGSELLPVTGGSPDLKVFATRGADGVSLMFVNTSREEACPVVLEVGGETAKGTAAAYRLSQREYFWNPLAGRPEWSEPARETRVSLDSLVIPPFTAMVVKPGVATTVGTDDPGEAEIDLVMPAEAPADLPVEALVVVRRKGSKQAWQGVLEDCTIEVSGPAKASADTVATGSSVGAFELRADGPGESVVRVRAGELAVEKPIRWKPVQERREVIWGFGDESAVEAMQSDFGLSLDSQARPNQAVAATRLENALARNNQNALLAIKPLPKSLDRKRVGGVIGLVGGSPDLSSADPRAAVQVVLQSDLDHWIPVGRVPLRKLRGGWHELDLRFNDPKLLDAMPELYSLRFILNAHQPVTGRIYFDDLGFVLR